MKSEFLASHLTGGGAASAGAPVQGPACQTRGYTFTMAGGVAR